MSKKDRGFYSNFLSDEGLAAAAAIDAQEGGEIAALRRRLMQAMNRRPEEMRLLVRGANALVRAAAAEHRMPPGARKRLADSMAALMDELGEQLLPAATETSAGSVRESAAADGPSAGSG